MNSSRAAREGIRVRVRVRVTPGSGQDGHGEVATAQLA